MYQAWDIVDLAGRRVYYFTNARKASTFNPWLQAISNRAQNKDTTPRHDGPRLASLRRRLHLREPAPVPPATNGCHDAPAPDKPCAWHNLAENVAVYIAHATCHMLGIFVDTEGLLLQHPQRPPVINDADLWLFSDQRVCDMASTQERLARNGGQKVVRPQRPLTQSSDIYKSAAQHPPNPSHPTPGRRT